MRWESDLYGAIYAARAAGVSPETFRLELVQQWALIVEEEIKQVGRVFSR